MVLFALFRYTVLFLIIILYIWLFFLGAKNKHRLDGKVILGFIAVSILACIVLYITSILAQKPILEKADYYGEYTIDRDYFSGENANWQYNSFRFKIEKNDSIILYITDGQRIINSFSGKISTVTPYSSARLKIDMGDNYHHVFDSNPTIYRESWGNFFLVFNSPKYHNMYFRKGSWEPLPDKPKK